MMQMLLGPKLQKSNFSVRHKYIVDCYSECT